MPEFMHCCSGPISIYRLALEAKQGRMARRKKKHGAYNENLSSLPLKEPGVLQPADKVKSFFGTVAKLVLCNMSVIDQSSHITAEEANERSPPRPSHAAEPERTPDTAEETGVDTCSNDDASATSSREQPPSKRSRSSRRQWTCEGASNAGEGTSHEAVAQACMEHLEHIRANKGVIKKDNIGFFALRTDVRLRELPVHIAQDVMHAVELMLYEAEAKLHQSSEAN
ncbi:uncharacterized protein LOC119164553 isoform X3 [Rhipicephalus microplus]|uniref:uncharacterized protein LOC119164553 isoform X3 n=1 Tax=Rhipicephalus microplus TaxID=6941 RepID=UPI003F6CC8C0